MTTFTQYRRKQIAELRPYQLGDAMERVSVSAPDKEAGSPKIGDMIARNPKNHDDQWLVAAQYFADNFEPVPPDVGEDEARSEAGTDAMVAAVELEILSTLGQVTTRRIGELIEKAAIAKAATVPRRDAVIDECIAAVRAEASRRRTVAAALSSIAAPDEHHAQLTGEETAGNIEAALVALKSHPAPPAQDGKPTTEDLDHQQFGRSLHQRPAQDERGLIVKWLLAMPGPMNAHNRLLADAIERGDHLPAKDEG